MRFFERSDRITFIDDEKSLEKQEKPRSSDRKQGNKGKINETKLPLLSEEVNIRHIKKKKS